MYVALRIGFLCALPITIARAIPGECKREDDYTSATSAWGLFPRQCGSPSHDPTANADCQDAKHNVTISVNCWYDLVNPAGESGYLNYFVYINASRQHNVDDGWCNGILANVHGSCGNNPTKLACSSSDEVELAPGVKGRGLRLNFRYPWPWVPDTDVRDCVKDGVQRGSCFKEVSWVKDGCRKIEELAWKWQPGDNE